MLDAFKDFLSKLSRITEYYGLKKPDEEKEAQNLAYAERMRVISNLRRTVIFTVFLIIYLVIILSASPFKAIEFKGGAVVASIAGIAMLGAFMVAAARLYDKAIKAGASLSKKDQKSIQVMYSIFWTIYYGILIFCEYNFTDWIVGLAVWMPMAIMGMLVPVYSLPEGFLPMSTLFASIFVLFQQSGFNFKTIAAAIPAVVMVIVITDINHVERVNAFYQEGKTIGESFASRRRLGNVFEEVYDMAFELDPQKEICLVLRNNDKYAVKYEKDVITFDEFTDFAADVVHPDDVPTMNKILNIDYLSAEFSREDSNNQVYAELRLLTDNDEYSWVSVLLTKEKNVDNSFENGNYVLCLVQNIEERKKNEDRLKLEAEKDPLTQLYNKMTTRSLIEECIEKNPSAQHALIIIDIDNFKTINDTRGHAVGDQILVAFANELGRNFRETDILGRAGGDEFVVLIKNIQSIALVCDKLQQLTSAFKRYGIDSGFPGRLSTSIGVAVFSKDGTTYEELFKKADAALYEAKRNGKDQYKFSITRS